MIDGRGLAPGRHSGDGSGFTPGRHSGDGSGFAPKRHFRDGPEFCRGTKARFSVLCAPLCASFSSQKPFWGVNRQKLGSCAPFFEKNGAQKAEKGGLTPISPDFEPKIMVFGAPEDVFGSLVPRQDMRIRRNMISGVVTGDIAVPLKEKGENNDTVGKAGK